MIKRSPSITKETADRVWEKIRALNYTPNVLARSLRLARSRTVGLMVTNVDNPFYSKIILGAEEVLRSEGYGIFLCNNLWDSRIEADYVRMLLENRAAGIIITPAEGETDHLKAVVDSGTPVVFIDRKVEGIDTDYVINDIVLAGRIATEHLIRLGHRRIGHISGAKEYEHIIAFQDIIAGYRQAHEESELAVDADLIKFGGLDIESGQKVMRAFLEMNEPPTAVFCVNDLAALGAMAAIYEAGLKVPEDVAIVGIDDIEVSALPYIGLTTVSQPEYEIGRIAAQIILERISGRYQKGSTRLRRERIVLKPKLMIRNSCGARPLGKGGEKPSHSVDFG